MASITYFGERSESPLTKPAAAALVSSFTEVKAKAGWTPLTYAASGVDIDVAEELVRIIKVYAKETARPGATAVLGGFGARIDLTQYGKEKTILVLSTDGVGTKLMIAEVMGVHDTVGTDLVAMSVNDG